MAAETHQSRSTLVWDGENFYISISGEPWSREALSSEYNEDNLYELFINNSSPADMMRAVDGLQPDDYAMLKFAKVPVIPLTNKATKKMASLYSDKPTRTELDNTRELIRKWGIAATGRSGYSPWMISFQSLTRASRDLNAACKLLLYSFDKCSVVFVEELLSGLPNMESTGEDDLLGRYYQQLLHAPVFENIPDTLTEYYFDSSDNEKGFVCARAIGMFNVMLSGSSSHMELASRDSVKLSVGSSDALVAIWAYFAERIQKDKVAVCARCGKIFIRKKTTGKYCSGSCSSITSRNKQANPAQ